jgi:hypothetical protein
MKYLCLICAEKVMEQMTEADAEQHFQDYTDFTNATWASGHYLGCNRLLPSPFGEGNNENLLGL